jgi:pimeloyl-ACP methyl ester carboxylesterase
MNTIELQAGKIAYRIFGGKSAQWIIIEPAMAASCAEWWHLAQKWSLKYSILVYDRFGYGQSSDPKRERSPENIAKELNELLDALHIKRIILLGHSIGGLYAYQFAKLFPEKLVALILIDPVSPNNGRFKKELTKEEYRKSGVNKSINLIFGSIICTLGLGFAFKSMLKKSPPFYYYNKFSPEAEKYILKNLTAKKLYKTAIKEYSYVENEKISSALKIIPNSLNIPLFLVCHTTETMKKEIEHYGNANSATSTKIENIWLEIMKEYLKLSENSYFMQANESSHLIHLTDPDILKNAIDRIASTPNGSIMPV